MNEECKNCTHLKECPDVVEYNSIYCKCHKKIPKNRTISYEELQQKVNQLETNIIGIETEKDVIQSQNLELKAQIKYYKECANQLETNRDEVIELLSKGVTFCENDSQGLYDKCNNVINREKKAIEILERGKDESNRY